MKILVHLHLYYLTMLDQMLDCLKNLADYDYDLYVTMVEGDTETTRKILEFKASAKIIIVENRGFDVAPFLMVLNQVSLSEYAYVIKLHTKRDTTRVVILIRTHILIGKNCWRNKLLEFISTEKNLKKALSLFADEQVGMVSNDKIIISKQCDDVNKERAKSLLNKAGLEFINDHFVAGTMFICRANLLQVIQSLNHKSIDFESYNESMLSDGTLAHAYERLFGFVIWSQNKKIVPLYQKKMLGKIYNFVALVCYRLIKRVIG